ncbi:MAG: ABC transporter substrate-binding protein [Elusimicrobia bacterium]|nr:ABC transporter substrate-binding protein [Elusimicrobiota bacterium]
MRRRRVLAAVLAALAAGTARAGLPADTLVYAITGDVDSLDPHWQYDATSHQVMWQTYETLVFYRGPSVTELDPLLATLVPSRQNALLSPDGLRYTFPIRKGVSFHDGTPLTPEDVKHSFLRFLLMDRSGGGSGLLLQPILGVDSTRGKDGKLRPGVYEAADRAVQIQGRAVVIELKKPFAPFLQVVAIFCPIVSKAWLAARGGWDGRPETLAKLNDLPKESSPLYERMNGTGPFQLERWDKQDKRLVLKRFDKYWRAPARLRRLVYKTIDEPNTRKLQLDAGDADAVVLERQFLPQVEGLEGVAIDDDLPFLEVHNAFVFNQKINPAGNPDVGSGKLDGNGIPPDFFSDADVRRAFAHSFDYEGYIKAGYRGKAKRARGPIPAGVLGHDDTLAPPAFDPARATESFKKAWGGRVWENGFKVTASFMQGSADRQLACQILKKNVETLNPKFHVEVRPILWSTWLGSFVAGKLPLVNARWAMDYPDPHNAVHPFLHSQGFYAKAAGYANPRADRLIEQAAEELEPDKRAALYRELQSLAAIDLPSVFTVDTYYVRVRRSNVKNWWYNPILAYGYFYPVYKE